MDLDHLGTNGTSDNDSYATESEVNAVAIVSLVTAGLSFLGSGSVLICSIYHKRICFPEIFPTFHLAIADVVASTAILVSSSLLLSESEAELQGSGKRCNFVMTAIVSFYTTAFFLIVAYALEAFFRFRKRLVDTTSLDSLSGNVVSSRWMYLVYVAAWLVPPICFFPLVLVNISQSSEKHQGKECSACFLDFQFDDSYCWNSEDEGRHQIIKSAFMAPMFLVVIFNMALYVLIRKVYRQVVFRRGLLSYHQRQEEKLLKRKTFLYQSVFCLCWLPSMILGVASFEGEFTVNKYYPLFVIQALLGPLQGMLNSIVYGWKRDSFRRALTERTSLLSTNRTTTMSVTL